MGEMADYYVDRMINAQPRFRALPKKNFCKTCGEEIVWMQVNERWSPQTPKDLDKRHICKPGVSKPK